MDETKRLEGIISIGVDERTNRTLDMLQKQFQKMEENVSSAMGGGKTTRGSESGPKGAAQAMQEGAAASKEWAETHKRILNTAKLTQRVVERQIKAEGSYRAQAVKMEEAQRKAKQAQVQAQMRMNAMHKAALRTNQQMTEEIRKQSGWLGVQGRRLQARGAMRGGIGGAAMQGAGGFMSEVGRAWKKVSSGLSTVWNFANRLLRVYWIALSMFYAIRNVIQIIGDSTRRVLGIGLQLGRVFAGVTARVIQTSTEIERLRARMMVMFGEKGRGVLSWVMEEAIGKPFEWTDLAEGVTRAMVMGVKDLRVIRAVVRVAEDMSVAFEQPVERGVQAIMQGAVGRFRSLIETFGFRPEMAVQYGAVALPTGQGIAGGMQNMSQNLTAILKMISDRVDGAADAMKNTWQGLVSDVKDMWDRLVNDIFEPTLRPLKAVLAGLREMFLDNEGGMAPWVNELVSTFKEGWSVVEDLSRHLVPMLPNFIAFMVATYSYFVGKFNEWYEGNGGIAGILSALQDKFFEWGPAIIRGVAFVAELLGSIGVAVASIALKVAGGAMEAGARKKLEQSGFVPTLYGNGLQAYGTTDEERARMIATGDPELRRLAERSRLSPYMGYWTPERYQQTAQSMGIADDPEVAAWLLQMQEATQAFDHQMTSISTMVDRSIEAQDRLKTAMVEPMLRAADAIETAWEKAQKQGEGRPQFTDILRSFNEDWAEHYERLQKQMGRPLTYEEVVKNLPVNMENSMERGAHLTQQAIEDGFETGNEKIKNMFDVAKFMGYTAMASRHGYGTQAAMNMAQERVLQEMEVRAGRGGGVTPWPWTRAPAPPVQTTIYGSQVTGGWGGGTVYPTGDPRRGMRRPSEATPSWWKMDTESWGHALGFRRGTPLGDTFYPGVDGLPRVRGGGRAVGGSLKVHIQVDTEEGIRATVKSVQMETEQDRVTAAHR